MMILGRSTDISVSESGGTARSYIVEASASSQTSRSSLCTYLPKVSNLGVSTFQIVLRDFLGRQGLRSSVPYHVPGNCFSDKRGRSLGLYVCARSERPIATLE